MLLSQIESHPKPKAYLEQYTIPPELAAEILYAAAYTYNDITGKTVADLGCGTGRIAIGAALLGAKLVIGVDIDRVAVKIARKCAERLNVGDRICWVAGDIEALHKGVDTVLQNPPFGVQRREMDTKFLLKALSIAEKVYSLHKSEIGMEDFLRMAGNARLVPSTPSSFLKRFIEKNGGTIEAVYSMRMKIPHMFNFHRKRVHEFVVDLYVIKTHGRRSFANQKIYCPP